MSNFHLPRLLNPLLNSILNYPKIEDSPLSKLYAKINHLKDIDDLIILLPPSFILYNYYYDLSKKITLLDLCLTNQDFLSNHILIGDTKTGKRGDNNNISNNNKNNINKFDDDTVYSTLNGRDIIIRQRNHCLFTSNGFPRRLKVNILKIETLNNFNDYLNKNISKITLIYIDHPLIDAENIVRDPILSCFADHKNNFNIGNKNNSIKENNNIIAPLQRDDLQQMKSSFENIIHIHTDWSKKINSLLSDYRRVIMIDFEQLVPYFRKIIQTIFDDMQKDSIFKKFNNLKLLIQEYCELNLYEDIWESLVKNLIDDRNDKGISSFQYLSLDQLDTDFYKQIFKSFRLSDIVQLEKNISNSIRTFNKLSLTRSYSEKSKALVETLQILSNPIKRSKEVEIPIDADTLMSLFVLIINRSHLRYLKCHLYYLQKFYHDENSIRFGLLGYALSTLEAVIFYMESLQNDEQKLQIIEKKEEDIKELVDLINSDEDPMEVPEFDLSKYTSSLKYRDSEGRSILSFCIINFQNNLLLELLSTSFELYFPLEDLLDDQTTDGSTLLMQSLKCGNNDISMILTTMLINNCTKEEITNYLAKKDKTDRNVAYYLNDQIDILKMIGKYINWDCKDCLGQTPLFTIFRSYDQTSYDKMVTTSFNMATLWCQETNNEPLRISDHEDSKGNTLLHILKHNISILLDCPNVDINKCNRKGLTPLMVNVKYERLENIQILTQDPRLILTKSKDSNHLNCFDYAKDNHVLHLLAKNALVHGTAFNNIFAHSLKFHQNSNYSIKLTVKIKEKDREPYYKTISLNLKTLKNLLKILLKRYPLTFLPIEDILNNFELLNSNVCRSPLIGKLSYRNIFLHRLTNCLDSIIKMRMIPNTTIFMDELSIAEWIQEQKLRLQNDPKQNLQQSKKKLEPEEINIIQNFLKYNLSELQRSRPKLIALQKLAIFISLKSIDIKESRKMMKTLCHDFSEERMSNSLVRYCNITTRFYGHSTTVIIKNLEFLEKCLSKIYDNISQLLYKKIPNWWALYGEFLELKRQKNKMNMEQENRSHNHSGRQQNNNEISKNIFSGYLESRRIKDGQKLDFSMEQLISKIALLNREISGQHEMVAEELSKFIVYKTDFFRFGIIKLWVRMNNALLDESLLDLQLKSERYCGEKKKHEAH